MDKIRIVHCYRPPAQNFNSNSTEEAFNFGLAETRILARGYIGRAQQPFHLVGIEEFGTLPPERDAGIRYRIVALYSVHEDVAKNHIQAIERTP